MKKLLFVLACGLLIGTVNVKAVTESELKTKLLNGFEVAGEVVKPTDAQKNEIERYLNKYDISESDATTISNKIDEIVSLAKADGAKNFTELSSSSKSKIVSIVAEISNQTSVKASLTNDGALTIYESDGKTVFTKISDKDIAKQTGSSNITYLVALVMVAMGSVYVYKKAKNA